MVLKFLITSRPYEDLDDRFQHLRDVTNYVRCDGDEHSQQIAQEINIVIDARIKEILPNHSQSDQTLIANRMRAQGNRTYLWLFLTIDIIKSSRSKYRKMSSIQNLMDELPIQIADAYEKILNRSSDEMLARTMLQIMVAAREPLSLEEANIALSLATQPECQTLDALDLWPSETFSGNIKNICGLLVTCYDDQIALIHQTAREFLLPPSGPAMATCNSWQGSIEPTEADELMAEICTKYLTALDPSRLRARHGGCVLTIQKEKKLIEEKFHRGFFLEEMAYFAARFRLLKYSAQHWVSHYRGQTLFMGKSYNPSFQRALLLCDAEAPFCEWWLPHVDERHFPRNARSSLLLAIHQGLDDLIKANLAQHSDKDPDWVNYDDTDRSFMLFGNDGVWGPPLHLAITQGRISTVKTLIDFGADVNLDSNGVRPLHIASANGNEDLVELLLNNEADVNASVAIDKDGDAEGNELRGTALIFAVESGHFQITRILLKHGANVNARASETSLTALIGAIHGDHIQMTKLLLDHEADTELTGGRHSFTPLQAAVLEANYQILILLLQSGADVNAKTANGVSAIHIASHRGQKDMMEVLLHAGADINAGGNLNAGAATDSGSNFLGTPLWLAALGNHPRTVNFLLDHGADADISMGLSGTPLGVAKRQGFEDVANLLMGKGQVIWNDNEGEILEPPILLEIIGFIEDSDGDDLFEEADLAKEVRQFLRV